MAPAFIVISLFVIAAQTMAVHVALSGLVNSGVLPEEQLQAVDTAYVAFFILVVLNSVAGGLFTAGVLLL